MATPCAILLNEFPISVKIEFMIRHPSSQGLAVVYIVSFSHQASRPSIRSALITGYDRQ